MSDAVTVALIVSAGPTLVGAAGLLSSLSNRKSIGQVHRLVNSGFNGALEDILLLQLTLAQVLPPKVRKKFLDGVAVIRERHILKTSDGQQKPGAGESE